MYKIGFNNGLNKLIRSGGRCFKHFRSGKRRDSSEWQRKKHRSEPQHPRYTIFNHSENHLECRFQQQKAEDWDTKITVQLDEEEESRINQLFLTIREHNQCDVLPAASIGNSSSNFNESLAENPRLRRNKMIDDSLKQDLLRKNSDPSYLKSLTLRQQLPAFNMRDEIVGLIEKNQVIVLSGETGCGKTTQVPQFILDNEILKGNGSLCRIVCTQPRRISALSVADMVARERAERCGKSVGYQIRFESKQPRDSGSILYCTTGIILQWLKSNRLLHGISHLVLDEVHERDLLSDFLLILVKDILPSRPDLKVILMSATIDAELFSKYFGNCPHIRIPGFMFPVKQYLLEDVYELLKYKIPNRMVMQDKQAKAGKEDKNKKLYLESIAGKYSKQTRLNLCNLNEEIIDYDLIVKLIKHISKDKKEGAILVFLPGWEDIRKVNDGLQQDICFQTSNFNIICLHSQIPTLDQKLVFERPPKGVRKIILATNIAETSITIDDVVYVVDSGKIKLKNFDKKLKVQTLTPEHVSLANANQRKGRAGRVQTGICYHLFTRHRMSSLPEFQLPEILRTRLEELCLQVKILRLGNVDSFLKKAIERPDPISVRLSIEMLQKIEALDENEELTPLGGHLANLPMDPQTGKMLLFGAMFSCLDPILTVAASLSHKDAFLIPLEDEEKDIKKKFVGNNRSDHLLQIRVVSAWEKALQTGSGELFCEKNFLSTQTLKMLSSMKRQLAGDLHKFRFTASSDPKHPDSNRNSGDIKLILAIIVAGLYPNIARINHSKKSSKNQTAVTPEDGLVMLHGKSVNANEKFFSSPFLVYLLKMKLARSVVLFDTSMVSALPIIFFGGKIKFVIHDNEPTLLVDDWVRLHCPISTFIVLKKLRAEMRKILKLKFADPGPIDAKGIEGKTMELIADLISSEEVDNLR